MLSGAGGIRTLVQTWYKVGFLHAYLLLGCREVEGQPLTCTIFRMCCFSFAYRTFRKPVSFFGAPVAGSTKQNTGGTKAS